MNNPLQSWIDDMKMEYDDTNDQIASLKTCKEFLHLSFERLDKGKIGVSFNNVTFAHIIRTDNKKPWFCNLYDNNGFFLVSGANWFVPYEAFQDALKVWRDKHSGLVQAINIFSV